MSAWLLTLWSLFAPNQQPLAGMILEGSFQANGYYVREMKWARPRDGEVAYDSGPGPQTGVARSQPFILPAEIHFATAGFLSHPGFRIYLFDEDTHRTLDLRERIDPAFTWRTHFWKIPSDWRGARVRLIAEDKATGGEDWMGVTAPKAGGEPIFLSIFRAAYSTVVLALLAALFLLPGLAAASWAAGRWKLDFIPLITLILSVSGVASYAAFWVFLADSGAGKAFSLMLLTASAGLLLWQRRALLEMPGLRETAACLGFALLVAIFYSAAGFLYITEDGIGEQAQIRFNTGSMPPDNVLPFLLAERLYYGESAKPAFIGIWHGSDRPPLQAGAALLVFAATRALGALDLLYQLFSIFLQCLSLAALWVLVRAMGLGNRFLVPIIAFAVFSELVLFHSFYVWPKMLAAAFVLLAMAPVFRGAWTMRGAVLSATSLTLGILAHTGVLFTVVPFACLVLLMRRVPQVKQLAVGLGIALLLMVPWRWYQTVYDPPGDTLLKFNMTYAQSEADMRKPFSVLLKESYERLTPSQYAQSKWEDVKVLWTGSDLDRIDTRNLSRLLGAYETGTFFHLFLSLGLLNLGFISRIFAKRTAAVHFADLCLCLVAGSLFLWIFALYAPGATIIHQWSLASMLLLNVILVIYLLEGWPRIVYPLIAVQCCILFPVLVLAKPLVEQLPGVLFDAPVDWGMAMIALISAAAIVYWGWRVKLQEVA